MKPTKQFLTALATDAGAILLKYFDKVHQIKVKKNAGIVTEVDQRTEDFLVKKILKNFPNSSIITEEAGKYDGHQDVSWVIDPLDGTSNYAHGFPWFCVSIAQLENGERTRGVIYQPITKHLFYAEKGKGTRLNGKLVKVSREKKVERSLLGTGFYYSKGEKLLREIEIFRRVNEVALGVRRPGSAALDLAYVAAGRYDGFWERGLQCWDVAAGFLMVEESGGKISSYNNEPTTIYDSEVLATNKSLHNSLVQLIQGQ